MFHLVRLIIWIAGVLVIAYFVAGYFGYELNQDYFTQSKDKCQTLLKECRTNLIRQGIDNAECDYQCVDPKLIMQKKQQ